MKRELLFLWLIFHFACTPPAKDTVRVMVASTDTALHNVNGYWVWHNEFLNGYIIEKDRDITVSKLPVVNGKENGWSFGWYRLGGKKFARLYKDGKREGLHMGWHQNGTVAFVYHFMEDKYEGEQKTFYTSGHPWQSLHYAKGYEEGKQQTWNDSGRVVNNFTVKNGKLYGVIGRYDCMSVFRK